RPWLARPLGAWCPPSPWPRCESTRRGVEREVPREASRRPARKRRTGPGGDPGPVPKAFGLPRAPAPHRAPLGHPRRRGLGRGLLRLLSGRLRRRDLLLCHPSHLLGFVRVVPTGALLLSDRNYLALFFRMLRRLVTRLALALAVDFEALELAGFAGETFLSAILGTSPSWVPGAIQLL